MVYNYKLQNYTDNLFVFHSTYNETLLHVKIGNTEDVLSFLNRLMTDSMTDCSLQTFSKELFIGQKH